MRLSPNRARMRVLMNAVAAVSTKAQRRRVRISMDEAGRWCAYFGFGTYFSSASLPKLMEEVGFVLELAAVAHRRYWLRTHQVDAYTYAARVMGGEKRVNDVVRHRR